MKDDIRKAIIGIVKGSVLLIVAGAVFYYVYPKYYLHVKPGNVFRLNQVTGQMDHIGDDGKWEDFTNHTQINT